MHVGLSPAQGLRRRSSFVCLKEIVGERNGRDDRRSPAEVGTSSVLAAAICASLFPKIPGYFIVVPVYLIAEKAADVILKDNGAVTMPG